MITAVEARFVPVNRLPETIEWLTDSGSSYIAHKTKTPVRDMGLGSRSMTAQSPQSTNVIDKSFSASPGVFCSGVQATLLQGAGLGMQSMPRSLYRRSALKASVRIWLDPGRVMSAVPRTRISRS